MQEEQEYAYHRQVVRRFLAAATRAMRKKITR